MVKKFYESKIFWTNVIAIGAIIIQSHYGYIASPDTQIAILGLVNVALRSITGEGLDVAGHNFVKRG